MARRRQADSERYIEADNGFGWSPRRASVVGFSFYKYETTVFGITYELEKRGGKHEDTGWYLYNATGGQHFFGEWCARTLLPAIDEASALIVKADLRAPGFEAEVAHAIVHRHDAPPPEGSP